MSAQISIIEECPVPDVAGWLQAPLTLLSERTGSFGCSILLTDPSEIRRLNREFRSCDEVTDVLSFPSCEADGPSEVDGYAGDIAICVERAAKQAQELGHSLQRELAFLALHGALHLHGWDHEDEAEAEQMFALQREIMGAAERLLTDD